MPLGWARYSAGKEATLGGDHRNKEKNYTFFQREHSRVKARAMDMKLMYIGPLGYCMLTFCQGILNAD